MGYGITPGSFYGGMGQQGASGGGNPDIEALLKAIYGNKGGVNPFLNLATQAGGSILGALGGLFSGPSWQEKESKNLVGDLKSRISHGPQQANMGGYLGNVRKAINPYINQTAQNMANRVGLDSGVAQAEIGRATAAPMAEAAAGYQKDWDMQGRQEIMQLLQMLASLTSGGR